MSGKSRPTFDICATNHPYYSCVGLVSWQSHILCRQGASVVARWQNHPLLCGGAGGGCSRVANDVGVEIQQLHHIEPSICVWSTKNDWPCSRHNERRSDRSYGVELTLLIATCMFHTATWESAGCQWQSHNRSEPLAKRKHSERMAAAMLQQ